MRISTMRQADRWLGAPVCAILTVWRRVADLVRRTPPAKVRRILFVKLVEQGATVLAWPALKKAVDKVGPENVFFMVFQENRFIVDALGLIPQGNVLAIRTRGILGTVFSAIGALWRARRARVDAAIDMEFFARSSAALCYLSGAPVRVGLHPTGSEAAWRGDLLTHRLSYNPHLHTSQTFEILVDALDAPADRLPALDLAPPPITNFLPEFAARPEEVEEVRGILRQAVRRDELPPIILLNSNTSDLLPIRRWPGERYVELAQRLLEKYPDVCIAFTGAPDEAEAVAPLVGRIGSGRCISLAGKTTLRQLLILYQFAEVLVTNDSGPAHFAALTPIDTVVLFGPETPALFGAPSPRTHILYAGIVCSPCVSAYNGRQSRCRDNVCMQRLTVDQVFAEVCRVYDSRP